MSSFEQLEHGNRNWLGFEVQMSTTIAEERHEAAPEDIPASAHTELAEALRQDVTNYSGGSIVFGIMLAGGAYPIVLCGIYLIVGLMVLVRQLTLGVPLMSAALEISGGILAISVGGLLCAFIGVVWAAIASALTLPVVYLFVRSLKLRGFIVPFAAVCGGLVGFVAVLPMTLSLPHTLGFSEIWAVAIGLALGPALTTLLGQIGGAWGGGRAAYYAQRVREATAAITAVLDQYVENSAPRAAENRHSVETQPRLQFRIVHMLWIFLWLSLVLSAIKLSGIPFEFVLPLLAGWFVYQLATLRVAIFVARFLGPPLRRWRRRST